MSCPFCGEVCECSKESGAAVPRWMPDAPDLGAADPDRSRSVTERPFTAKLDATSLEEDAATVESLTSAAVSSPSGPEAADDLGVPSQDESAWRGEIAARLTRYQARRKPRPPRYPSLYLHFESSQADRVADGFQPEAQSPAASGSFWHALALDRYEENAGARSEPPSSLRDLANSESHTSIDVANRADRLASGTESPATAETESHTTAKIIQFPRSSVAPPLPLEELAEPLVDRPRILEAPAVVPPPPALGGITIEAPQRPMAEKRPGVDIPLQGAPLGRRMLAAVVDVATAWFACSLFGLIFWKLAAVRPPNVQLWGLAVGLAVLFWGSCQYLLIVYSGTTPGLALLGLRLARFDGSSASRRLRRWRVLASFLSCASLGMGYLWVFLDEDALCWHDRITRTYLARRPIRRRT